MSEPLIPFVKLKEIPLSFLQHIPVLGDWIDPADPPSIKPFGTLVALGVYLGTLQAMRRAKERGYDPKLMSDYVFWTVATGFVLSHVLDAIFYHPSTVARNPLYLLKIWDGLSSYGGFVGAVVGSLAWGYYRRQKVLGYIDITVSAMPLAWVFGRAGCSVVHDHPGVLSDFWLAVRFPPHELMKSVEWVYWGPPFVGRFDLGFLEFLLTIPLAVAVAVLWRRKLDRPNGYYISVVCLAYAPVRFVLDFLRLGADAPVLGGDPRYGGLTPAQWASAALFATAAVVLVRMYRTPPSSEPALAAAGPVADEPPADEPPADEPPADEPAASTPPAGAPSAPSSDSAHEPASSGPAEAGPGAGAPAAERVERDDPPSTR